MSSQAAGELYLKFERRQVSSVDPTQFSLAADPNRVFTTFSTVRLGSEVKSAIIIGLDYHLERLIRNAEMLGVIDYSLHEHDSDWIKATTLDAARNFLRKHAASDVRLRLVLSHQGFELFVGPYTPRWPRGSAITAALIPSERAHTDIKSTAIEAATAAREAAQAKGFDEALLVNREGFVTEGSYSNLFWFDAENKLFTVKSNILPGVTRRILLENERVELKDITATALLEEAVEVFLTQSTTGVTPVIRIDNHTFSGGQVGPQSKALQDRFWDYVPRVSTAVF